jgi:hypothetical protein
LLAPVILEIPEQTRVHMPKYACGFDANNESWKPGTSCRTSLPCRVNPVPADADIQSNRMGFVLSNMSSKRRT